MKELEKSKLAMCTIAKRSVLSSLALAEANRGGCLNDKFFRLKTSTFMRAIAERAVAASTA